MENNQIFEQYRLRLVKEGIFKALLFGVIAGFAATILTSIISLAVNYNGILLSLLVFVVVVVAVTPIVYTIFFRPNTKQLAERIDRLGLEERLVTMMELENDNSYIVQRQREDAKEKLGYFDKEKLKIALPTIPLIVLASLFVCSLTMIIVAAVSVTGKMGWNRLPDSKVSAIVRVPDDEYDYHYLEFAAFGGGYIDGELCQVVVRGEDAELVRATPYEGFVFIDWIDTGETEPERWEKEVVYDIIGMAQFQPLGDGEGEGEEPDPSNPQPDPGDNDPQEFNPDVIINGNQDFRDPVLFDAYTQKMMEYLSSGREIPYDLMHLIQNYFETLKAEAIED